jgi:hypothetical protein
MPGRIFELNSKETDEHSPKKSLIVVIRQKLLKTLFFFNNFICFHSRATLVVSIHFYCCCTECVRSSLLTSNKRLQIETKKYFFSSNWNVISNNGSKSFQVFFLVFPPLVSHEVVSFPKVSKSRKELKLLNKNVSARNLDIIAFVMCHSSTPF